MYSGLTDLAIRGSGEETRVVSMPTVSIPKEGSLEEDEDMLEAAASNATIRISEDSDEDTKEEQIMPSLITLTMLPKTQWKGLVNLDIIKVCCTSLSCHESSPSWSSKLRAHLGAVSNFYSFWKGNACAYFDHRVQPGQDFFADVDVCV